MTALDASNSQTLISYRSSRSFVERHGLFLVAVSPVLANMIGSVFNILYNKIQIWPLLTITQLESFDACWQLFNLVIYPLAVGCWVTPILWLRPIHRSILAGESVAAERLQRAQRYVVNFPWWILIVSGVSWLLCVPVFPAALHTAEEPSAATVVSHLMASFVTASLIAIAHSFFAVELVSQRALYPVFFQKGSPVEVPGAVSLGITGRGIMWALSAVVSPIISLVLLLLVPDATREAQLFGTAVGFVAIAFALTTLLLWITWQKNFSRQAGRTSVLGLASTLEMRLWAVSDRRADKNTRRSATP